MRELWDDRRLKRKWTPAVTTSGTLSEVWLWACHLAGPRLVKEFHRAKGGRDLPGELRCQKGGDSRERPEFVALRDELGDQEAPIWKFADRSFWLVAMSGSGQQWRAAATRLKQ